jgi:hypothetical protein
MALLGADPICFRSVADVAERDAVIRVYDVAGNVIETHEHKSDFWEP